MANSVTNPLGAFRQEAHAEGDRWAALTEPGRDPQAAGARCSEGRFSRGMLRRLIDDEARRLRANGVIDGDRVVIASENCHRAHTGFHGAIAAGATAVPLNVRLHPREMASILADVDPSAILCHPEVQGAVNAGLTLGRISKLPQFQLWRSPSTNRQRSFEWHQTADPVAIFTTSGSTGRPKGVMLTAASLLANAHQMLDIGGLRTGKAYLHAAPVFHLGDASTGIAAALSGCEHIFMGRFDARAVAEAITKEADWTMVVPTMLSRILDAIAPSGPVRLKSLVYGGAITPYHLARRASERLGPVLYQAYGLSEFPSVATVLTPADHTEIFAAEEGASAWGTVGQPVANVDVDITADSEVRLRGPNMMSGYWRNPEATSQVINDGWLLTGDTGRIDERGRLRLTGRIKDVIITGGENVYANEVELEILTVPGVEEVAVFGVDDADWGERVHAVVFAHNPMSAETIRRSMANTLTSYKQPKSYTIQREPLPRNTVGKVDKRYLRALHDGSGSGTAT